MNKLRQIISEHTPISISLLIALSGGLMWITNLYAKTEITSQAVIRIESNQLEYYKHLQEINERLSRIEGRLEDK